MTCNPDWPEIKEAARVISANGIIIQQSSQDRPDLVARIAKQKFDEFINDLDKKQIFGKVPHMCIQSNLKNVDYHICICC